MKPPQHRFSDFLHFQLHLSMSSHANDSNQKTLIETLITIFHLSRYPITFEYTRRTTVDAVPIAIALLVRGYDPHSLSDDLWKYLTNTVAKNEPVAVVVTGLCVP
ncbi:hypothetical protein POJ06DRAFT_255550 [Lipomyces tetrasporus]|uniref:Uncharacterized protein n=1 Tax=Lipomyces tetrasporus TaxID=54092 RepID=A0AAD7QRM5_9ASCO|nr:uncharacterized protein POJ06DRAFT_255550 [Lipomyces tetrasporus]KAJ8100145.1 hypothetical protein POJ06DRAFT_255550 [Lipomyces tetrasporus]